MSFGENVSDLVASTSNPVLGKAEHWQRVQLGELAKIINGYPWDSKYFGKSEGIPLLRIRDVTSGCTETYYSGPLTEGYSVKSGDLIVGMDGDFNLRRWASVEALLNQRVCKIEVDAASYSDAFLEYVLPPYLNLINDATSSTTVKHLSSRTLAETPVPLPPLAEQRRIVAKLDALTAHLANARAELDRVPVLASRLRQACLNHAFSDENLSRWKSAQIADVVVDGLIGLVRSKAEQGNEGAPYLRMGHYDLDGSFNEDNLTRVACSSAELSRFELLSGDVLFNTRNSFELVGKVAIWPERRSGWVFNNNILRLRFKNSLLSSFAYRYMMSPAFREGIAEEKSATTSVAAIYQRSLYAASIPMPSADEQRTIVDVIEAAFARADRLEAEAARARALLDRFEAAILAKAFRGELVPQDPTEEPASVLLDRIRAERDATPKLKRGRRASSDSRPSK